MPYFETICDRIRYVRGRYLPPFSADSAAFPSFADEAPEIPDGQSPLAVNRNRLPDADFQILLYVYDRRGIEWSVSPLGTRRVKRTLPRRGWYHKHEYVEILYVIEGSFDQILLGERCHFPQGAFVITDQNCEHSDYIEAADAAVLFLQITPGYLDELLRSYPQTDELHRFLLYALHRQKREQSFLELTYAPALRTAPTDPCSVALNSPDSHEASCKAASSPGAAAQPESCGAASFPDPDAQPKSVSADTQIPHLLEQLVREDLERLPGYEHIRRGLLIRLLQRLCTDYSPVRRSSGLEGKEKALLYELERYIRLHDADVTISDLERHFHYHRNYFNLLLRKYRGQTFKKYVQSVRLDHACQLLEETSLPVRQIALSVGYENTSYFYHLFEDRFGVAPQQLRHKHPGGFPSRQPSCSNSST